MVEKCIRCRINGEDVRLFDAIYDGKMESICERCSIIENIPIIKKPSSSQLKESEQAPGVYDRMKQMSGIRDLKKEESFFIEDKLKELDEMPELELPEREKLNLIDHFHWHIMKQRRKKGLTQEKLASAIGEGVIVVQMLESGKLPEHAEKLLKKLEQFFQFRLKNITETERILMEKRRNSEPVLLDEFGKELENIPEPEFEIINEEIEEEDEESEIYCNVETKKESNTPLLDDASVVECEIEKSHPKTEVQEEKLENEEVLELEIKNANPNAITIADLREMHKKKLQVTKQERLEEQRRIEERQRLIEAKKEELRSFKERESNELDTVLGGVELLEDNGEIRFEDDN